jgi:phosphoribosylaminoimidazole-succinocarboxamide synthase
MKFIHQIQVDIFYNEGYQERLDNNENQKQLSKEFVREWLMENGFQGKEGQVIPEMTDEIISSISNRYIELYEKVSGDTFTKSDISSKNNRIKNNVLNYLNN